MGSILGRGDAISEGKQRKGVSVRDQEGGEGGAMTSRHGSVEKPSWSFTRAGGKQCPSGAFGPSISSFTNTRLSAVVALGALFPEPAGDSADPAKADLCSFLRALGGTARHCASTSTRWSQRWSTNIQPYFVILFLFDLFCWP